MGAPWPSGPWTVEERPRGRLPVNIIADGVFIAVSRDVDAARLIAAAPDLAEACRMLVESYDADMGTYALGKLYEAREAARTALSKARGETP